MIKSRILDIKKWADDNVVETLLNKLGVPLDNIIFVDRCIY